VPTYFEVVAPWGRPQRMEPFQLTARQAFGVHATVAIFVGVMIVAILLARRHLLLGRGDRRGATRLALFAVLIGTAVWTMEANHAADAQAEIGLFMRGMASSLLIASFIFILYLALEPFVRRRWPRALVTWARVLSGRLSDPEVGRDILVGAAGGAFSAILLYGAERIPRLIGLPSTTPWWFADLDPLLGPMMAAAEILSKTVGAVGFGLGTVLLFLLLRTILRRDWLAAAVLLVLVSLQAFLFASGPPWFVVPAALLVRVVPVIITLRFGVLATVACIYVGELLIDMPLTADLSSWKGTPTLMAFAVVVALAIHGFRAATAGHGPLAGRTA
jgi:serine/threonine-protein kinase